MQREARRDAQGKTRNRGEHPHTADRPSMSHWFGTGLFSFVCLNSSILQTQRMKAQCTLSVRPSPQEHC